MRPDLAGYYQSDHWRRKRQECLRWHRYRCGVCGWDWRKRGDRIEVHHFPCGYDSLGGEDIWRDLVPLCRRHHPRGRLSRDQVGSWHRRYLWQKALTWALFLPIRALAWLLRRLARTAWRRARRAGTLPTG